MKSIRERSYGRQPTFKERAKANFERFRDAVERIGYGIDRALELAPITIITVGAVVLIGWGIGNKMTSDMEYTSKLNQTGRELEAELRDVAREGVEVEIRLRVCRLARGQQTETTGQTFATMLMLGNGTEPRGSSGDIEQHIANTTLSVDLRSARTRVEELKTELDECNKTK